MKNMFNRGKRIIQAACPAIVAIWLIQIFVWPVEIVLGWAMIILVWVIAVMWLLDDKEEE